MVRGGFTTNEEAVDDENSSGCSNFNSTNSGEYIALKGYFKLLLVSIVVISVIGFRTYILERVIVNGESMKETFFDGDILWAQKFNLEHLERFDVVVAQANGQSVIKRIIGLPNETVTIIDDTIWINGELLEDRYDEDMKESNASIKDITLGANEYFLMGDNRQHSVDSRNFGPVSIDHMCGKVIFQIYPFNRMGVVSNQ